MGNYALQAVWQACGLSCGSTSASLNDHADGWQCVRHGADCLHDVGWLCLSPPSMAGCQGVVCVPADNLQGCCRLSMSPVGNYALQAVWRACGAFLWICHVQASTIMLMGGNVSGMVQTACMMSAGSACRLHRWQAVKVWCVCQRTTCKDVEGFPCRLWATMPCRLFGGLVGLPCGSAMCKPQRSC